MWLDRWEAGAFLEGTAFAAHVLGRPKIDRINALFIGDFSTVLANVLAGEAHLTLDNSIRFQQGAILKREWATRSSESAGTVLIRPR